MDTDWLAALRAQAHQRPRAPRVPLWVGGHAVGTVELNFFSQIDLKPSPEGYSLLFNDEQSATPSWHLRGDPTAALAWLAQALRQAGLSGAWRDEQLAVTTADGLCIGTVERAAVRPLGIATHAVHLVGAAPDGRVWVQQRALDKANDPGLWDTLMGGMVSAADALPDALARETWEEAGLRLDTLQHVEPRGRFMIRRPSEDGGGAGYVVEVIDWFSATVPAPWVPVNQDGEVAQFALLNTSELRRQLVQGAFTLEAALILAQWLEPPPHRWPG